MEKEVRAKSGKSLLLPYPENIFQKKVSAFWNVLEKAVRKEKNESLFQTRSAKQ